MTSELFDAAHDAFLRGDLAAADEQARAALEAARTAGDRAALGDARRLLGEIAHDELRYGAAREHLEVAVRDLEGALGPAHLRTRSAHASLAIVLHTLRDDEAAERALALAEAGPAVAPEVAASRDASDLLVSIGIAHASLGRSARAQETIGAVVDALEHAGTADSDPARVATAHLQLSSVLGRGVDDARARASCERCLELRRKAFAAPSPRVAAAAFGLARILATEGKLDAARALAEEAMSTMEACGQLDAPRMSTGHATLGLVLLLSGDTAGATKRFERACVIEEKSFGAAHASTAAMMLLLAQVHAGLRNWGKVAGICRRIVPVLRASPQDTRFLSTAAELEVLALCALGRDKDARTSATSSLEALARHGAGGADVATVHAVLARAELAGGRPDRAIVALERAAERAREGDDPELAERLEHELSAVRGGARPIRHRS